jgi:predicted aspartyl protease
MGMTYVTMQVANAATPDRAESLGCLVDSGANYSVVLAAVLARLGIEPFSEDSFFLANGQKITRKRGVAVFKYDNRIGGADVIFGEEGDENLLGALTLEALGLGLDPLKRRLFELPLMLTSENP